MGATFTPNADYEAKNGCRRVDGIWYKTNGSYATVVQNRTINMAATSSTATNYFNFTTYSGVLRIPEKVTILNKEYTVNSIAATSEKAPGTSTTTTLHYPFRQCNAEEIYLPAGITQIPQEAFALATKLRYVDLPATVTSIKTNAFKGATALDSINLPDALEEIASTAFSQSGLRIVRIPALKTWGSETFMGCPNLQKVYINSVATADDPTNAYVHALPQRTFEDCDKLEEASIHSGITSFGAYSFGLRSSSLTSSLKRMYFTGKKAPTRVANDFANVPTGVTAYIPEDLTASELAAYQNWVKAPFTQTIQSAAVGVEGINADSEMPLRIFTIGGTEVNPDAALAPGIYIEVNGNKSRKVIVR